MESELISHWQALQLGVVEGFTEFLPVSSTGHLILLSEMLGLRAEHGLESGGDRAIKSFEVIIQVGAIVAVVGLYKSRVAQLAKGVFQRDVLGRKLLRNLIVASFPILIIGAVLAETVEYLQNSWSVVLAISSGGLFMLFFERVLPSDSVGGLSLDHLNWRQALIIGICQCFALWPGMSRSMTSIVGGMAVGMNREESAEFSFLIGVPVLIAASVYKLVNNNGDLFSQIGLGPLLIGFVSAAIFAWVSMRFLVRFLNAHSLAVFGWYRIALSCLLAGMIFR